MRLVGIARLVSRRLGQRRSRRNQYNDNDDRGSHLLIFTALRSRSELNMNLRGSVAQRIALGFGLVMVVDDGISAWPVLLGTFALDQDPAPCACGPRVQSSKSSARAALAVTQQCANLDYIDYIETRASSSSCRAWVLCVPAAWPVEDVLLLVAAV